MKWYFGVRSPAEGAVVRVAEGWEVPKPPVFEVLPELPGRQDLMNHSPTGLEWGYGGSGPAQAALAMLADATGDDAYALAMYQTFKEQVVGRLPASTRLQEHEGPEPLESLEWFMPALYVEAWAQHHPADRTRIEYIRETLAWKRESATKPQTLEDGA